MSFAIDTMSEDANSQDVKSQDASPYLYVSSHFIDNELTESPSRESSMFISESATFQEIDGKKVLVIVSNFPVQDDPLTTKLMAIDDYGISFELYVGIWGIQSEEYKRFVIGHSSVVTPKQMGEHDKKTPMRVPFNASLHRGMANGELEIRFAKKDRVTVISGITITIPYAVYKSIGTQLSKIGIPDNINRFLLD